ncbi:alpha/beta fold hydrolase [Streptomyces sp. NPDC091376]|uniref:alpha/beta fold hydrolase n=1 Tax=Streptomyces sp. NPDC091376 TaxID=3365994 RepID=UPI00380525EF
MTLSHDVAGHGPVVVLLHSSVCDRRMWDDQWKALTDAGHRVVRCDFRGFGDTPAEAVHPYRDADDVLALLDTLGVGRAALVGASFGGRVAVEIAARNPERVTALALLCAALPGHEPGPALRDFDSREDELIEADDLRGAVELNVTTWLGPEATEAVRERVRAMQRHAFEVQLAADEAAGESAEGTADESAGESAEGTADEAAGLEPPESEGPSVDPAAITAPSLVVSGAHDMADFRAMSTRLARLIPDARHIELAWAGHLPSLERPAEATALLTAFLREHAPVERAA